MNSSGLISEQKMQINQLINRSIKAWGEHRAAPLGPLVTKEPIFPESDEKQRERKAKKLIILHIKSASLILWFSLGELEGTWVVGGLGGVWRGFLCFLHLYEEIKGSRETQRSWRSSQTDRETEREGVCLELSSTCVFPPVVQHPGGIHTNPEIILKNIKTEKSQTQ